jgi:hypothetical protein
MDPLVVWIGTLLAALMMLYTAKLKKRFRWSECRHCLRCRRPETNCVCRHSRRMFMF